MNRTRWVWGLTALIAVALVTMFASLLSPWWLVTSPLSSAPYPSGVSIPVSGGYVQQSSLGPGAAGFGLTLIAALILIIALDQLWTSERWSPLASAAACVASGAAGFLGGPGTGQALSSNTSKIGVTLNLLATGLCLALAGGIALGSPNPPIEDAAPAPDDGTLPVTGAPQGTDESP